MGVNMDYKINQVTIPGNCSCYSSSHCRRRWAAKDITTAIGMSSNMLLLCEDDGCSQSFGSEVRQLLDTLSLAKYSELVCTLVGETLTPQDIRKGWSQHLWGLFLLASEMFEEEIQCPARPKLTSIFQIVGPQVYIAREGPCYRTGLLVDIACWSCLIVMSFGMALYLEHLNKRQYRRRTAAGRMGNVEDMSIMTVKEASAYKERLKEAMKIEGVEDVELLRDGLKDLTDIENMDFLYVSNRRLSIGPFSRNDKNLSRYSDRID